MTINTHSRFKLRAKISEYIFNIFIIKLLKLYYNIIIFCL